MKKYILTLLYCLSLLSASGDSIVKDAEVKKSLYDMSDVKMPQRIFTKEFREQVRRWKLPDVRNVLEFAKLNDAYAAKITAIPDAAWDKIISDKTAANSRFIKTKCPFCNKNFYGVNTDIFADPEKGKTICCKSTVFARKSNMPERYRTTPNKILKIPHLDGKLVEYEFYAPGQKHESYFSNEGEIAWTNLNTVIYDVIPQLESQVIFRKNPKAAHTLAVIFARLAEVYPAWPFYNSQKPLGFATGEDFLRNNNDGYLTAREWQAEIKKRRTADNRFSQWNNHNFTKLVYHGGYGSDGYLKPGGILAEAWDLVYDDPEVKKYSKQKFGDPMKLDALVRENIFASESLLWAAKEPTLINMMTYYLKNALKIAIVARDENLFRKAYIIYDGFIYNHYFDDGLSTEGAFNYSAMMGFYANNPWIYKHFTGTDFSRKYALAKRITELGDYPITTLYNIESFHGDEHTAFFTSKNLLPPEKTDYSAHRKSQFFPTYGISCLRSGVDGSRLEAILDAQNQIMHAHNGRLNLQLFYEGINLMPDIGYCTGQANVTQSPWKNIKTAFKVVDAKNNLSHALEGHCTGSIDGNQWDKWHFIPKAYIGDEKSFVQFVDIDGTMTYAGHPYPVSAFERKIITLTFKNGRSCLVDIFRMKGGKRHDMYFHIPGDMKHNTLKNLKTAAADSVYDWYLDNCVPTPTWRRDKEYIYDRYYRTINPTYREETKILKEPSVSPIEDNKFWTAEWEIDPLKYTPESFGPNYYNMWKKFMRPVNLKIWGTISGSKCRNNLLIAKGDWPSNIMQYSTQGKVAGLKNSMDYLFINRQGNGTQTDSTFVHILEPFNKEQGNCIKSAELLTSNADGIFLKIEDLSGEVIHLGLSFEGKMIVAGNAGFDAKLAAWSNKNKAILYDGKQLTTPQAASVRTQGPFKATLKNVSGDITGKPLESALFVESKQSLPIDGTLKGQTVYIKHQTAAGHTSAYEIEKITETEDKNIYRIDLANKPPFIQNKFFVAAVDPRNPGAITVNMRLFTGINRPWGIGRKVKFLDSSYESSIKDYMVMGYAGWWSRTFYLKDTPRQGRIKYGEPVIVYSVAKGDEVVIPNFYKQ